MSSERWSRLAADLAAAGITATVDERPYTEIRYGRPVYGVSRSITLRHPHGGLVEIGDQWWRKNLDVWLGWQAVRSDSDDIIKAQALPTKRRREVVATVQSMLSQPAPRDP